MEQVREWVKQAQFQRIDEGVEGEYHHFLVQRGY
jgi:hypothetical protein